jgi:hypothetical protein
MPSDIFSDKILINLRILSKIPKNGKICRSSDGVISLEFSHGGFLTSLRRFLTADSRKQTLIELNKIVNDAISKYKEIVSEKGPKTKEHLTILRDELDKSIGGLENLKTTYQNDQTTVSHLDILILRTRSVVLEMTSYIANKFVESDITSVNKETVIFI